MAKKSKKLSKYCKFCALYGIKERARSLGMCVGHYKRYERNPNISKEDLAAPLSSRKTEKEVATLIKDMEPSLAEKIFALTKSAKSPVNIELLSDNFNVSVGTVRKALAQLQKQGKNIQVDDNLSAVSVPKDLPVGDTETAINVAKFHGKEMLFGFTADNHLCSKYARLDVLNALYDIWVESGVSLVLQGGNMIDGECRFNRFDLLTRSGVDAQAEYLINEWPQRKGITTEFVCGDDHEGWYVQKSGINIVDYLNSKAQKGGRKDMKFMAYMEHTYTLKGKNGQSRMSLIHAGGGSTYAHSYTVQKIVESYQPNEKPSILLVGHYHKASFDYPRAVLTVQAGCTQDQTPFLRKKKIEAMIGGWSISMQIDDNGIVHRFKPEFHPFYDRDFYHRWKYHWKPKAA